MIKILLWLINLFQTSKPVDAQDVIDTRDTITINLPVQDIVVEKDKQSLFPILLAGHGELTKGKRSPKYKDWRFYEYNFNIKVINSVRQQLDKMGWQYVVINDDLGELYDNDLDKRLELISLSVIPEGMIPIIIDQHANAYGNSWNNITGTETWVADIDKNREIRELFASIFQKNMVKKHQSRNRGVKMNKQRKFRTLYETPYLAFLLEAEFFTNLDKALYLSSKGIEMQEQAIVNSLIDINKLI